MSPSLPPGPRLPALIQGIGFWTRPRAYLEVLRARYGNRFTTRLPFQPPFVMLADPGEIEQVFKAPPDVLHPGEGARILEPVVGANSVILLDEDPHLEQRRLMLPAFHGDRMARLDGLVREVTEREVASWPVGEPIELVGRTQRLTLEIILRAVFGLDPGPRLDALRGHLTEMLTFGDRAISVMPPPRNRYTEVLERVGPFAEFVRTQRKADRLIFELVEERRRDGDAGDDVLSMLIEARHGDGSPMSQDELRDELMTLLVAGHETTASSLAWGFERLARSPDVVAGLRDEIDAGSGDAYLTATIQEILRRRPVLPNAEPRLVRKPIEVGGWAYPTGVCLVPSVYLVHHDPAIYPDPYEFRPERFLDRTPGTYTWIPFGGGRRRCVGASFATLEMKVVLETVLARADVRPAGDGVELARRRNITVRPAAGGRVVLSPARVPAATR